MRHLAHRMGIGGVIVSACLAFPACSLPRPVVYHDPLKADEHVHLGDIYLTQGHLEPARHEFEAALRQDPRLVSALVALGNVAFQGADWSQAESYYRRVLEIDPHHPAAANNLAMVYLTQGERFDEVERLAREALTQRTSLDPYIYETLATLYLKQGRLPEAQAALEQAESGLDPSNHLLRDRLRQLRHQLSGAPVAISAHP